jgi:hypothetical protein
LIYEEAIKTLRRHIGEAFKAGMPQFPYYTLHGIEHLEELDRLAILLSKKIGLEAEDQQLLRLAILFHDYAMVDVPGEEREKELRQRLGLQPDFSFPDLVRETHQDEFEQALTRASKLSFLTGMFSAQNLRDAAIVAKHHRKHDLDRAPRHLQGLCALMRLIDELDIGSRRAPLATYQALRSQMNLEARSHWLKHLCTRAIDANWFALEQRGSCQTLKVYVVVEATTGTWRSIQEEVAQKLRQTLGLGKVNAVLRETFQLEVEIVPETEISGDNVWLATDLRTDLEELEGSGHFRAAAKAQMEAPVSTAVPTPQEILPRSTSLREFKLWALPPELVAEHLCRFGRLTVVGNTYVPPPLENVGGKPGAPSRIYVGPADCGKTRAALEWILDLTRTSASQWVVLRTDLGILPDSTNQLVLDTSFYEKRSYQIPPKAILFVDDLPLHFPPADAPDSLAADVTATESTRRLFTWFRKLPYFRERRVVGSLRLEDVHARPEWPGVLPSLDVELELLRVNPLLGDRFRWLWRGMTSGSVAKSVLKELENFQVEINEEFLAQVARRPGDPEAVATFIQQEVLQKRKALRGIDAERYQASAVETWMRETWPAVLEVYGEPVRVFLALARFLEAGLRPGSGFLSSISPYWNFHEAWGGELTRARGGDHYLEILRRLLEDGHALGEVGKQIRPRFDFLLQAEFLAEIDEVLPAPSWFAARASQLSSIPRRGLAMHLAAAQSEICMPVEADRFWWGGWAFGLQLRYFQEKEHEQKSKQGAGRRLCSVRPRPGT